jgi:hypothetical protein
VRIEQFEKLPDAVMAELSRWTKCGSVAISTLLVNSPLGIAKLTGGRTSWR